MQKIEKKICIVKKKVLLLNPLRNGDEKKSSLKTGSKKSNKDRIVEQ
jgi:hypothetical protein